MVSGASIAFIVVNLVICFLGPVAVMILVGRRHRGAWRAFACGMLAFFVSQVLTRLPLMLLVVPTLPEPAKGFLQSAPVASFSAGLFEETGRLVVMLLLLKAFHRLADGVAFGLGHGGLEAMLIVGLTNVNNLVLALMINSGQWATVAASLPAATASQIEDALTRTPPFDFALAGIERIGAVALHVCCSLIVLAGIVHGRKLLGWLAAVSLHGCANLIVVSAVAAKAPLWVVEGGFVLAVAALLVAVVRLLGPGLPDAVGVRPSPPSAVAN